MGGNDRLACRQVFISASSRSAKWAAKLAEHLRQRGITPWLDLEQLQPGDVWRQRTEQALRDCQYVITVFDSDENVDAAQRRVLTEVLNAIWDDRDKRLIPVLLRDARLPEFMQTAVPATGVQAVRIAEPRTDLDEAATKLAEMVSHDKASRPSRFGEFIRPAKANRREQARRLSYISGVADVLKSDR
jgi:hypothetical protein